MKYSIFDLMDRAAPVEVALEDTPLSTDPIKRRVLAAVKETRQQPARRRWGRVALAAACCAALMTVSAIAGALVWGSFTVRRESDREVSVDYVPPTQPDVQQKQLGADFERVFLPTVFPGEAALQSAWRMGSDDNLFGYQWEWQVDGHQLLFGQLWGDTRIETQSHAAHAGVDARYGQTELAGVAVDYICHLMNGKPNGWDLLWSAEGYLFELRYGCGVELETLAPLIASVQPVGRAEYDALLAEYDRFSPVASGLWGRKPLDQVLFPGDLPEGPVFGGNLKEDSFLWYLAKQDAGPGQFLVQFYQEDLSCLVARSNPGQSGRRWELEDNDFAEEVTLAGQTVRLLGGGEGSYVWDYFWQQAGNWCDLRIDQEAADLLGVEVETLAERIIAGLKVTDAEGAEKALEKMK